MSLTSTTTLIGEVSTHASATPLTVGSQSTFSTAPSSQTLGIGDIQGTISTSRTTTPTPFSTIFPISISSSAAVSISRTGMAAEPTSSSTDTRVIGGFPSVAGSSSSSQYTIAALTLTTTTTASQIAPTTACGLRVLLCSNVLSDSPFQGPEGACSVDNTAACSDAEIGRAVLVPFITSSGSLQTYFSTGGTKVGSLYQNIGDLVAFNASQSTCTSTVEARLFDRSCLFSPTSTFSTGNTPTASVSIPDTTCGAVLDLCSEVVIPNPYNYTGPGSLCTSDCTDDWIAATVEQYFTEIPWLLSYGLILPTANTVQLQTFFVDIVRFSSLNTTAASSSTTCSHTTRIRLYNRSCINATQSSTSSSVVASVTASPPPVRPPPGFICALPLDLCVPISPFGNATVSAPCPGEGGYCRAGDLATIVPNLLSLNPNVATIVYTDTQIYGVLEGIDDFWTNTYPVSQLCKALNLQTMPALTYDARLCSFGPQLSSTTISSTTSAG